jgi:hypothetical protein
MTGASVKMVTYGTVMSLTGAAAVAGERLIQGSPIGPDSTIPLYVAAGLLAGGLGLSIKLTKMWEKHLAALEVVKKDVAGDIEDVAALRADLKTVSDTLFKEVGELREAVDALECKE